MLLKILIGYISGYLNIYVEGYFIERFINICISKKILLWNMKREKSSILYANIGIKDFLKLKSIVRTTKCKVNIKNKKGMPFLLNKYKKRKIFLILLLIIISLIIITSNFVWNIEIKGADTIDIKELICQLNEQGLDIGRYKVKIDTKQIINEIRLKRDDIAWMAINLKGTNAVVEIVEATSKPEIIDEDDICNIVSDKEGIITKINVQNGTAQVKIGDMVKNGTVLIGGYIEGKYTGTRYVHSNADIEARVWYTKKEKMNLTTEIEEKTNNSESKYSLNINNFVINLYKNLPNFENYDTIIASNKIKLFSNLYLPIELIKTTYYETQKKKITYGAEEAKEILIQKIEQELIEEIPNKEKIVNKQVNAYQEDDAVEIEVIYEVIENIGTKEKINM